MISIKQQVLREFGDHGADTLKRYFAQIEYTAYWCIRMLRDAEGIDAVIPEGVDDVLLIRQGVSFWKKDWAPSGEMIAYNFNAVESLQRDRLLNLNIDIKESDSKTQIFLKVIS